MMMAMMMMMTTSMMMMMMTSQEEKGGGGEEEGGGEELTLKSSNPNLKGGEKEGFEDRLGAVLGRFWVVLGAVLGPWKRSKHYACRCFVKIHVFEKKRCQEVTWTDLVSILEAKRVQNGRRGGSESEMR